MMNQTKAREVLNHYSRVHESKVVISDFIEWMTARGIKLDFEDMPEHKLDDEKPDRLVESFLGIDPRALIRAYELLKGCD